MPVHPMYSGDHIEQAPRQKPTVVSDVRRRQAVTGHNARYVLLFGTCGAAIALALVLAVYFH